MIGTEAGGQARDVLRRAPVDDVQVLGQPGRAVRGGSGPAHEDKFDMVLCQKSDQ